jgi:serpin B
MIEEIIKEFNGAELMMLIKAIVFEVEWESIYYENMVWDTDFTTASGDVSTVQGMYSEERTYLKDENTQGFIKDYRGNYQLVALLPDEDVDIDTYVKEFTAEKYFELLDGKQEAKVDAMLPKFQYEYSVSMVSTLKKMGMEVAFDPNNADFTNMAECDRNIYIGDVIHKTYIEMAEKGTKAAAVTAVIMDGNTMMPMEEIKEVHLDRPFMYMIIDERTKLPLFVGVVRDI